MKTVVQGQLLSLREAAAWLGFSPATFYNCLWSGRGELAGLPFYRIGRSLRFAKEDIERFVAQRRVEPARPSGQAVPPAATTQQTSDRPLTKRRGVGR